MSECQLTRAASSCPLEELDAVVDKARGVLEDKSVSSLDPLMALGLCYWRLKDYEKAFNAIDRISSSDKIHADYFLLRGMILRRLSGRAKDSFDAFRRGIKVEPSRGDAYYNLGNLLSDDGRYKQAERSYRLSLELSPDAALTLHNLGISLNHQQRFSEGLGALQKSLHLDPSSADAWCNYGLSYFGLDRFEEAKQAFAKAISLDQQHGASHVNMGNALVNTLEPDKALSFLHKGVELESSSANSLWNLSLAYLLTGDFQQGWEYYEARFATKNFEDYIRPTTGSQPASLAECSRDPANPLVVWTEQGIGDAIQFGRYLPMLEAAGIAFVFMTRPSLLRLFREWFPIASARIEEQPSSTNAADQRQQIPLLSLPRLFKTDLVSIPSVTPYMQTAVAPAGVLQVPDPPGGLSVGLVWASNPTNQAMYRNKSCPLALLMPRLLDLINLDLIDLHSLQFGADADQLNSWRDNPRITDWSQRLDDFADTAHVVRQLDLVISVDTAVAHMAGALQRNTWLLLPHNADFRWLRQREDSPWYPTMRLFRQPNHNDWDGLVAQVNQALDELFMFDLQNLAKAVL